MVGLSGMQALSLPATPLARAMWKFGSPPAEAENPSASEGASSASATEKWMGASGVHPGPKSAVRAVEASEGRASCPVPGAEVDRSAVARRPTPLESRPRRYKSVDPVTGRVWGVPSAFGRGPCLDCPEKAMLTHLRCEACQAKVEKKVHEAMAPSDVQFLETIFSTQLASLQSRQARDAGQRLAQLYESLRGGGISKPSQQAILGTARAIQMADNVAASKSLSGIASKEWEMHKHWVVALRRLVGAIRA